MLQISPADVVTEPFPHVIKENILDPVFYAELKAAFPDSGVFKAQTAKHGTAASRTGAGYDLYRGDDAFADLVGRSAPWKAFADYINSEAFADTFRDIFKDSLDDIGLRVNIRSSHVDPTYVEPRETLAETTTMGDRLAMAAGFVFKPFRKKGPTSLFTRLDIHRSLMGYRKPAHCDRSNRLCSLIVYFTDAEEAGLKGGDLTLYAHKIKKPIEKYERYPKPDAVNQIAQLRPKENLGVFFPCQNNSYHGVTSVVSDGVARDFLYINISGRAVSLW